MKLKHTPTPWVDGKTSGSIISRDELSMSIEYQSKIDCYGGVLICESVKEWDKAIIKAAPDAINLLKRIVAASRGAGEKHKEFLISLSEMLLEKVYDMKIEEILDKKTE